MQEGLGKPEMSNENELITQAQQGDADAFGSLYDLHVRRIYRFIFLKTGNKNDAEDLTHEVFLSAWRTVAGWRERDSVPFASWLYQIARNRVIDWYRTRKSGVSLDELIAGNALPIELASAGGPGLMQALHRKFEVQAVMDAVRGLSDDQQDVVIMRFVEDLSAEETGTAIGKTASAVRLIQHRAIQKLKKTLEEKNESRIPHRTA